MSKICTPAEIAEKRRIAIERLKARQQKNNVLQVPPKTQAPTNGSLITPPFNPTSNQSLKRPNAAPPQDSKKPKIETPLTTLPMNQPPANGSLVTAPYNHSFNQFLKRPNAAPPQDSKKPKIETPLLKITTLPKNQPPANSSLVTSPYNTFNQSLKPPNATPIQGSKKPNIETPLPKITTLPKNQPPANSSLVTSPYYPSLKPSNAAPAQDSKKPNIETPSSTVAPVFRKVISCTCCLFSETRFLVTSSGFHAKLISIFKSIASKRYDEITREWTFDISDYQLLHDRIYKNLHPDITIGKIPKFAFETLEIPIVEKRADWLSAIEPKLASTLMEFQKEGVCFGIAKNGRCLLGDDMGLGKTFQALGIADFYKDDWPMLICTTASTRDIWQKTIQTQLPYVSPHDIVVMTGKNDNIEEAKVLIMSYTLMEKNIEKLLELNFGVLIMDESHALKNFKAKSTTAALRLADQAIRVILLTGTPALSRPVELFTQLRMIDKNFLTFKEYSIRYCAGRKTTFGWDSNGQSNLPELHVILNRKFMIRRVKADVLTELAEKSRETVILDPALIWKNKETDENLQSYADDLQKCKGRDREEILLRFYAISAEAKAAAVCAYVKTIVQQKTKFIIFAHHQVMLNAISECLNKLHLDFVRIDGQTPANLRNDYISRFQENKNCMAAVLSLKACNAGITLTAASLVLFAELDWNPSTLVQAESRAHRIGQENAVIVRYLMAKGTADDVIWEMLKSKQSVLNKAGLSAEDFADSNNKVVAGPSSTNKIDTYFKGVGEMKPKEGSPGRVTPAAFGGSPCKVTQMKPKEDIRNYYAKSPVKEKETEKNEFQMMLDDDDDILFAIGSI